MNGMDFALLAYARNSRTRPTSGAEDRSELIAYGSSLSSSPLNKHHAVFE
jgi:hypothetical protein